MTVSARFDFNHIVSPVGKPIAKSGSADLDSVAKSKITFVEPVSIEMKQMSGPESLEQIIASHMAGLDLSLDGVLSDLCIKA